MTGRVFCLGDVMVDVLASLPGPLAIGSDTPAPIVIGHGGSAANTAAWLASVGASAVFMGRVGADAFGDAALAALAAHGVRTDVVVDHDAATGICVVLIGPDGERTMVPSAGANDRLSPDDLPTAQFTAEDRLHVSGYALLREGSREAATAALKAAGQAGLAISVDAASAQPIRTVGTARFLSWIPRSATLIANADEARALTGCREPAEAASRLARRFALVAVKCGPMGAALASSDRVDLVRAEPTRVVDSTGAGDAFAAGFLAHLGRSAALVGTPDPVDAARAGNELAARAVRRVGARPPVSGA
jgi:sugar/nucleoside kinase (ribokinase family)